MIQTSYHNMIHISKGESMYTCLITLRSTIVTPELKTAESNKKRNAHVVSVLKTEIWKPELERNKQEKCRREPF